MAYPPATLGGSGWTVPAISGGIVHLSADGTSLVDGAGNSILRGALTSGEWVTIPTVFRLRITGTGTVIIDSRDSLGNVSTSVESYTANGATDQIEFPYAGDNAVAIRATLTGNATAEVI